MSQRYLVQEMYKLVPNNKKDFENHLPKCLLFQTN
ncbi:hypothetical protein SAMN05444338_114100 [Flavobacterium degerlachei]|uniref:Uncharacterized protein n=1 Tax=Flavobacterium degerlachei TaxID=229203 RepID=A0A1H3EBF4_9FLAO|nr:hypothetical protein SAMN05444338_114100 [Flavobacterium degerlachei]